MVISTNTRFFPVPILSDMPGSRSRTKKDKSQVGLRNMSVDNKKYKQNEMWLLPDCLHLVLDHTVRLWGSLAWAPLFDLASTQRIMRRRCLWWAATSRTISFSGHVELPTWTTFSSSIPLVAKRAAFNLASIHLRNLNLFFWKWYAGGKPRSRRDFGWRMQNLYGIPRFQLDREKVKSNHWTSHNTDRTTPCSKKER